MIEIETDLNEKNKRIKLLTLNINRRDLNESIHYKRAWFDHYLLLWLRPNDNRWCSCKFKIKLKQFLVSFHNCESVREPHWFINYFHTRNFLSRITRVSFIHNNVLHPSICFLLRFGSFWLNFYFSRFFLTLNFWLW